MWIKVRGIIAAIWSYISTAIYSILCVMMLMFSKKAGYKVAVIWSRQLLACGGVKTRIINQEKINPHSKYILVSNHQSNLDIPALISTLPVQVVFVAKKELFNIPFLGWAMKNLGEIAIDRSSPRKAKNSFVQASKKLREESGLSLIIFPEGTRSNDGILKDFKQGSFALALETGLPILPIAIKGTYDALPKHSLLIKPARVEIIMGDVIEPSAYQKNEKDKIAVNTRRAIAELLGQPE